MPNRYLRASYVESERVNTLAWQAECFWLRLLVVVDDWGRCEALPRLLRTKLFPLRLDSVREADVARLIAECEKANLIRLYSAAGKEYLQMLKWEIGRAKVSRYPAPPEPILAECYINPRTSAYTCTQPRAPVNKCPDSDPGTDPDSDSDPAAREADASAGVSAGNPRIEEVLTHAILIGLAEWKARDWFDEMDGCGWLDFQHREIRNWKAVLNRVRTKWEADGRPTQPPTNNAKTINGNTHGGRGGAPNPRLTDTLNNPSQYPKSGVIGGRKPGSP